MPRVKRQILHVVEVRAATLKLAARNDHPFSPMLHFQVGPQLLVNVVVERARQADRVCARFGQPQFNRLGQRRRFSLFAVEFSSLLLESFPQ